MVQRLKAILLVMALSSVLPELLSGNTPLPQMLTPESLVIFVFAYGFPVVLIREWAVRRGTSAFGIFVMGIGYGLINEGLYARTIFRESNVPVDTFDFYSYALGVNWGWAAAISVWHGLCSILMPIVLTHRFYPDPAPWLGRVSLRIWAIVTGLAASGFFLMIAKLPEEAELGTVANEALVLPLLWLAILGFWIIGSSHKQGLPRDLGWRLLPFILGLSGLFAFVTAAIPSNEKWPVFTSFLTLALVIALYVALIRRYALAAPASFVWFAVGWYVFTATYSAFILFATSPETVVADAVLLAALVVALVKKQWRKPADAAGSHPIY